MDVRRSLLFINLKTVWKMVREMCSHCLVVGILERLLMIYAHVEFFKVSLGWHKFTKSSMQLKTNRSRLSFQFFLLDKLTCRYLTIRQILFKSFDTWNFTYIRLVLPLLLQINLNDQFMMLIQFLFKTSQLCTFLENWPMKMFALALQLKTSKAAHFSPVLSMFVLWLIVE